MGAVSRHLQLGSLQSCGLTSCRLLLLQLLALQMVSCGLCWGVPGGSAGLLEPGGGQLRQAGDPPLCHVLRRDRDLPLLRQLGSNELCCVGRVPGPGI